MDGFVELIIGMWVVAVISFAPLGYFIYIFGKGEAGAFGKSDPAEHNFEDSKYYDLINNTLSKILGGTGKSVAGETEVNRQTTIDSTDTASDKETTGQAKPDAVVGKGYGSISID